MIYTNQFFPPGRRWQLAELKNCSRSAGVGPRNHARRAWMLGSLRLNRNNIEIGSVARAI